MNGMNDGGWIKLHRRFLRSAIWQNPNIARFWTWCLLKATHDGYTATIGFKRIVLGPGQFLYNHSMACIDTGLSQKTVRNCLEFLKSGDTPEIGQNRGSLRGNRFSIITINNWDTYQADDSGEGNHGEGKRASKGQTQGSLYYKEGKNVKKHTGVATAQAPTESPAWQQWVAACRAACRNDPAPSSGALKAAKDLSEWIPDLEEQRRVMDAYLSLDDPWVKRQGYQLAVLTKHRIEAARAAASESECHIGSDDGVYEASPQILADFEELVCRPNREREGLVIVDGKLVKKEDARNEHGDGATGTVSA